MTYEHDGNTFDEDNIFVLEEDLNSMLVLEDEDDDGDIDSIMIVEDEDDDGEADEVIVIEEDFLPGSEMLVQKLDEPVEEVKESNWADDHDHSKFLEYLEGKMDRIPRHSGKTIPGCERALAYLKAIDGEISKAMRSDLDGKIDETQLDNMRKKLHGMINKLENHISYLSKTASERPVRFITQGGCVSCGSDVPTWLDPHNKVEVCLACNDKSDKIEKQAGTPAVNVYMTPFERAIVSTIINSKVSGGRNIEETYTKMKNKYNFTPREELAIQQLIMDFGYPVHKDRGLINEPTDPASGDNVEWQTNYYA